MTDPDLIARMDELSEIVHDIIEELDINADTLNLSVPFLTELSGRVRDLQAALRAQAEQPTAEE